MAHWFNVMSGGTLETLMTDQNQIATLRYLVSKTHKGRLQSEINGKTTGAPIKAPKENRVNLEEHDVSAARKHHDRGKTKMREDIRAERLAMFMHFLTGSSNPESPNKSNCPYFSLSSQRDHGKGKWRSEKSRLKRTRPGKSRSRHRNGEHEDNSVDKAPCERMTANERNCSLQ
ncbi:hypothetical protein Dsin_003132 [Dipteronia sinensis]|uniref:Uncharacterized protein n=1 Tax=Dipteronia sinensis TaxID=43782 RepID=A0AAE0B738_9ROSI|nr:hypothetical protein Dsin_003132 [Dipteronia sinensis]